MAEKSSEATPSLNESCSTIQNETPSNNWWDSWLTTAKTRSAEVYTMVKKDLDEIGTAVKSEASHVFNSTSSAMSKTFKLDEPESPANVMKKNLSTFIGQVSTVLNPEPDDEDDTEVILSSGGDTTMLSTYKKELEKIERLDATFIVPPLEAEFDAWYASLETTDEGIISHSAADRRLHGSTLLTSQYKKLVPDAVTREQFWERYLFRVALLQDRLAAAARRQPITEPATDPVLAHLPLESAFDSTPIQMSPKKVLSGLESDKSLEKVDAPIVTDNVVTWEDEDFADDVELTEEQQILLLEEYEKEIASKKQPKTSPRDVANNNTKTTNTNNAKSKTKSAQTRDKIINKTEKKNVKTPKKSAKETKESVDNKQVISPKKSPKTDVCGNNLVEDYFGEKEVKDDASANSDESWEKEFEIEDVVEQKA